jgi:hypothetical protein
MQRETKITPKLSMNMISPPWKLLFETLSLTNFSLKNIEWGSGSLRAHQPEGGNGCEK